MTKERSFYHSFISKAKKSFQFKIGLVAFVSVFSGLILTFIASYSSIQILSHDAMLEVRQGFQTVNEEYLKKYIEVTGHLIEVEMQKYLDEEAVLADIFQQVIDHEEEMMPLLNDMGKIPYFKDDLQFRGRWYQNNEKEPTVVLVQRYLLDDKNRIPGDVKKQIKESAILDLIMPSIYKHGADKLWVYFTGGLDTSFMRIAPWQDVGSALDKIYPKHTDEPNWEAFNPGLVRGWETLIKESPNYKNELASLAIVKSPTQDGGTGKIIMTIRQPIWNKERSQLRGAVSIDVTIDEIIKEIEKVKLANTGFAYVAQSNGNILAVNGRGAEILGLKKVEESLSQRGTGSGYYSLERYMSQSIYQTIRRVRLPKGEEIRIDQVDLDEKKYILVQKNLQGLQSWSPQRGFYTDTWTLGFVVSMDEVFVSYEKAADKIHSSRNILVMKQLIIAAGILFFITMVIQLLSRKATQDLRNLQHAAAEITNENYDVKIDIKSDDEIGDLGKTIQNMINQIKKTFLQLHAQNEQLKNEIAEREEKERQIRYLKDYDLLTNLPNQLVLLKRLKEAIETRESIDEGGALILIGMDNFRNVNEVLGHEGGNKALQILSDRLKSVVQEQGFPARISGDEFAVIYNKVSSMDEIIAKVENTMCLLKESYKIFEQELHITVSIGISLYPADSVVPGELMRYAASALQYAKESGKGRYQFYDTEMNQRAEKRIQMITQMKYGIEKGEFELYYQPQVDLKSKKWVGVEALIRWNSPVFGLVMPTTFIPLAEETGLIQEISHWVIQAACTQVKSWQNMGFKDLIVSINMSAVLFQEKGLVEKIQGALEDAKLSPEYVEFEVTESLFIREKNPAIDILSKLREVGVRIAIDDFGTGYSSLSYVKELPIDKLKIDRSFIMNIPHQDDGTIANIIIQLGKNLNLKVNAEGVETSEHEAFLLERHCDEAQGYFYSKPLPAEDITKMMMAHGNA